jgi:NtrC-family two-component system response regulator AlgB
VRELRNAVERAAMLAEGTEVEPGLLRVKATAAPASPEKPGIELGDLLPVIAIEEEHIKRVLGKTASLKEAAEILGIDQATLWRRRKQYGV